MMDIRDKKVVIAGLGQTGFDTAMFLNKKGAQVFVTESSENDDILKKSAGLKSMGIKTETGGHTEKFISGAEMIIPCPGVPDTSLPVMFGKKNSLPVISEIELAYRFSPSRKIISITGTNGKTTTTSLLGFIFCKAGLPASVCGNIGKTFISEIDNLEKETFVILEASSFQLEKTINFRPFIGCLLNIESDHIDRHLSLHGYIEAKRRMFSNQKETDWAILNYDDINARKTGNGLSAKKSFFSMEKNFEEGAYFDGKRISIFSRGTKNVLSVQKTKLSGTGNIYNIMAAALAGIICGIDCSIIQSSVDEFRPLPHRFEKLGEKNGLIFINDSKSTNPHSVASALKSSPRGKTLLILGGRNKQASFTEVSSLISEIARVVILFGEAAGEIHAQIKESGVKCFFAEGLRDAVKISCENSAPGDTVLFSPGCASFDMFRNYKERGDAFKKEVELLH